MDPGKENARTGLRSNRRRALLFALGVVLIAAPPLHWAWEQLHAQAEWAYQRSRLETKVSAFQDALDRIARERVAVSQRTDELEQQLIRLERQGKRR